MIERIVNGLDLSLLHTMLALIGSMLAVYVMQLTHYEAEDRADPPAVRFARRAALAVLALGFLWSLTFSDLRRWQPWAPMLVVYLAIDTILMVRVIAIWHRIRHRGRYMESESMKAIVERTTSR